PPSGRRRTGSTRKMAPPWTRVSGDVGRPRLSAIRRSPAATSSAAVAFHARTASSAVAPSGTSRPTEFTYTRIRRGGSRRRRRESRLERHAKRLTLRAQVVHERVDVGNAQRLRLDRIRGE